MREGKPIPMFGDGSTARDYTYIDDILQGVLACTEREFGFQISNLGESHTVTLSRLIETIARALNVQPVIERKPLQPGDVPITYANVDKARRMLGYEPTTQIDAGVEEFVQWFDER